MKETKVKEKKINRTIDFQLKMIKAKRNGFVLGLVIGIVIGVVTALFFTL